MDRKLKKYLEDIRLAIEDIESFLAQRPRMYSVFLEDSMFRRAIEREIGIIGEAMNQILKLDPNISITDARKIVGTRNYVIHAYDTLRPDMIWDIVINDIPILKEEVNALLSEN
ncbi:MAG: DUF86 domain-containing protein [Muribaculaceae bacterium]|nr:DUF86 domain-containing protein [Muribaculaceae bacterium]